MKIGIDARLINETGVGRYIRNLIAELSTIDVQHHYIVYLPETSCTTFVLPNNRWEKRLATPRWHTLWEQVAMPLLFLKDKLDILHVPYFNVPILYPGKFIVTVHDLTILHFLTGKATTLWYPFYMLRRFGYWVALTCGIRRAVGVIVPSQTTKEEIVEHFHIPASKIHVTYEGVDSQLTMHNAQCTIKIPIKNPYFLYVGNAYPHKNLEKLIIGFQLFLKKAKEHASYQLILVGNEDFFYRKLKAFVKIKGLESSVQFFGYADDHTLYVLYTHAESLVFPSIMEGFGLPALEALSVGTPVLCSDISVFHEILKDFPLYFDQSDASAIAQSLELTKERKKVLLHRKKELDSHMKQFSWKLLGKETMKIYTSAIHIS